MSLDRQLPIPPMVATALGGKRFNKLYKPENPADFRTVINGLGISSLPSDDIILSAAEGSPLAEPMIIAGFKVGNRWAISPMEGWDGTREGAATASVFRRFQNQGESGAKLLWGCEAFAVDPKFRANPQQLCYNPEFPEVTLGHLSALRETIIHAHDTKFGVGASDDLFIGLQLTNSGRWCKPNHNDKFEPIVAYHHPVLDKIVGIQAEDDSRVITDAEIRHLIARYVEVSKLAQQAGFNFVDLKLCHGYLGHEFLSAYERPGPYGGSFEGRTRFITELVRSVQEECPGLRIGVRLSVFDSFAYQPDPEQSSGASLGPGIPRPWEGGEYPVFGADRLNPTLVDLAEPILLVKKLHSLGVCILNVTAGSPYYSSHLQRPAIKPPEKAYEAPEHQLLGSYRQLLVCKMLKEAVPEMPIVGSAFTPYWKYTPHVGQAAVRDGWVDFVGLGRMFLAYPAMPADCMQDGELHQNPCAMVSECTSIVRVTRDDGMPGNSGCLPFDKYYQDAAREFRELIRARREAEKIT